MRKKFIKKLFINFATLNLLIVSFLAPISTSISPGITYAQDACTTPSSINKPTSSGKVGGVALDQAATFLANMDDITGAYYDLSKDRIVFIGKKNTSLPEFDRDDLATAIRAIFFKGQLPSVSIEPDIGNGLENVVYTGGIENTQFGKTLFEADYALKHYTNGYDENDVRINSTVTGYKPLMERYIDKGATSGTKISRVWISPDEIIAKRDTSTSSFIFDNVSMKVSYESLSGSNDPMYDEAGEEFAEHLTQNYDSFATEIPEWVETKQLAKIVGAVKWISDNAINTDFHWAADYAPKVVETPLQIPLETITHTYNGSGYTIYGGVDYNKANDYISASGTATTLKSASEAVGAPKEKINWTFSNGGQQYESVAVAADAFRSLGAYTISNADLSFPTVGDQDLEFVRSYSSFSGAQNGIGRGWSFLPAKLVDNLPLGGGTIAQATCIGGAFKRLALSLTHSGDVETFIFQGGGICGYTPTENFYHSKINVSRSNNINFYTITLKDQSQFIFNEYFQSNGIAPKPESLYSFKLISTKDKSGNTINYNYESTSSAKLTGLNDENGHEITITYNSATPSSHLISRISDWENRTVEYGYDDQGNLTSVTDPLGNTTQYAYDENNKLTSVEDRESSNIVTNTYLATSSAKLASHTDASGLTTRYAYHESNRTVVATDSANPSRANTIKYDTRARILQDIDAYGNAFTYTYATESAPLTTRDKNNNLITNTYDSNGNLTSTTNADNKTMNFQYDNKNNVTRVSDGRYSPAKISEFFYDSDGNLEIASESGRLRLFSYYANGLTSGSWDPLNNLTFWSYDAFGNKSTETNPNNKTRYFYSDTLGRRFWQTDESSKSAAFSYDDNNNLTGKWDAVGTNEEKYTGYQYDGENRLSRITQPNGAYTQLAYNESGSLTEVSEPLGATTIYSYDQYQNLTSRLNALNKNTSYEYDKVNRRTETTTPLGDDIDRQYDKNGNIIKKFDSNNNETNYEYDELNRLVKITYDDASEVEYEYDSRGNLISMVDSAGTTLYEFDKYDRLVEVTDPYGSVVSYQYDLADNLIEINYPGSKTVEYEYDDANRLTKINDWNNEETTFTYYDNNLVHTKSIPNGITTTYSYDKSNRLSTLYHSKNGSTIVNFAYMRNSLGDIVYATESGSLSAPSTPSTISVSNLATGADTDGSNGSTTTTVSPSANKLLLLSVSSRTGISTNPNQPTITGNGLTWVPINTVVWDETSSSRRRTTLFRAMGTSPSSGTISISFSGQNQTDVIWIVDEASNVSTSGTNGSGAIVQSSTNDDESGSATGLTTTLSTFSDSYNATYGSFGLDTQNSPSAGSGFSMVGQEDNGFSNSMGHITEFKSTNDTSVDVSNNAQTTLIGGVAVELAPTTAQEEEPDEVSASNITTGADTDGNSNATTTSISPGANKLLLLSVSSRTGISANPNQPTITGNGLTWVPINTVIWDETSSSRRRTTLFRAMGASPSSGTISISFGGQNQTDVIWVVDSLEGADTSGTNGSGAIIQSAINDNESGSATGLTVSLSSFENASNAAYGTFAVDTNNAPSAGTGFSIVGQEDNGFSNSMWHLSEFKSNSDTSVDFSNNGQATLVGGIAVEVKPTSSSYLERKSFAYDTLNRLLTSTSLLHGTDSYTYDLVGNMLISNLNGSSSSYSYNDDNELTTRGATSYSHDSNGNITAFGNRTLSYDYEDRLSSYLASGSSTFTFIYDGNGNRIAEKENSSFTKKYVNDITGDLENVLIKRNLEDSTDSYYLYGNGRISQGGVSSANRQYYLEDGIGNIRLITDSNGDIINEHAYDAYGNPTNQDSESDFKYKGEQFDPNTNFSYMRARYYDPTIGRFISKDPQEGSLRNPQGQNGYNYANGNPINLSDPSGEAAIAPIIAACGSLACKDGDCLNEVQLIANSATSGVNLAKSLASQQQIGQVGKIIAGAESKIEFRDAVKLAQQLGGDAANLVKKVSDTYVAVDGTKFQTHWVEDIATGTKSIFKTVFVP